jgi:signal transduction histidine kinase
VTNTPVVVRGRYVTERNGFPVCATPERLGPVTGWWEMRRRFVVPDRGSDPDQGDGVRRLVNDLHDGLGPTLAMAVLGLRAARDLISTERVAAEQLLVRIEGELYGAIADLRRLVADARPPVLDEIGLVEAVRRYASTLASRVPVDRPLRIEVDVEDDFPALSGDVEVAAYRIICEALTNVTRHSGAGLCTVRIRLDGNLSIEVIDDGIGAVVEPVPASGGIGLRSMRQRAGDLGGVCAIETVSSGGTRIAARLPLAAEV